MGSEKFGLWLLSIECFYNGDYLVSLIFRILYMIRFDKSFYFDVWVWFLINVNVLRICNFNFLSEKELNFYIFYLYYYCFLFYKVLEMKLYFVILNGLVLRYVNLYYYILLYLLGKECWIVNEIRI